MKKLLDKNVIFLNVLNFKFKVVNFRNFSNLYKNIFDNLWKIQDFSACNFGFMTY